MSKANEMAFPKTSSEQDYTGELVSVFSSGGLTKRELFAAMAMLGTISNETFMKNTHSRTEAGSLAEAAQLAVVAADDLIAELERAEKKS